MQREARNYGIAGDLHLCDYVARMVCSIARSKRVDVKVLPFIYRKVR